jgi:hypothetical protein
MVKETSFLCSFGVKPLIHQSELRTYAKVVPFKEKSSFHFVVQGTPLKIFNENIFIYSH